MRATEWNGEDQGGGEEGERNDSVFPSMSVGNWGNRVCCCLL